MIKFDGVRFGVALAVTLSAVIVRTDLARAGSKPAQVSSSGVCELKGEAVVVKLPPPSDQSILVVCDQAGPMKTIEPRPLSRAEAAKLYTDTIGSTNRDEHEKAWAEQFGIRASDLRKHDSDSEIGAEQLLFAQSENVENLKALAARYTSLDASKIRVTTLANDQALRRFDSGRLKYFGSACEQRGGAFSIPTDQLLQESLTGEPVSIAGKVVCRCGNETFSNPVDYSCDSHAKNGAHAFRANSSDATSPRQAASGGATRN